MDQNNLSAAYIAISTDGKSTKVENSDLSLFELEHLFFVALTEIPMSDIALTIALNRYNNLIDETQ